MHRYSWIGGRTYYTPECARACRPRTQHNDLWNEQRVTTDQRQRHPTRILLFGGGPSWSRMGKTSAQVPSFPIVLLCSAASTTHVVRIEYYHCTQTHRPLARSKIMYLRRYTRAIYGNIILVNDCSWWSLFDFFRPSPARYSLYTKQTSVFDF